MKIIAAIYALGFIASAAFAMDDAAKQQASDFATKATMSNRFEVEAARIEVREGHAENAKSFAEDMITDHGRAAARLEAAAKADGISFSSPLDDAYRNKLAALEEANSAHADQAYLSTQLIAHQQAVQLYEEYVTKGPDGKLKEAAAEILPVLRSHLSRARELTSK